MGRSDLTTEKLRTVENGRSVAFFRQGTGETRRRRPSRVLNRWKGMPFEGFPRRVCTLRRGTLPAAPAPEPDPKGRSGVGREARLPGGGAGWKRARAGLAACGRLANSSWRAGEKDAGARRLIEGEKAGQARRADSGFGPKPRTGLPFLFTRHMVALSRRALYDAAAWPGDDQTDMNRQTDFTAGWHRLSRPRVAEHDLAPLAKNGRSVSEPGQQLTPAQRARGWRTGSFGNAPGTKRSRSQRGIETSTSRGKRWPGLGPVPHRTDTARAAS